MLRALCIFALASFGACSLDYEYGAGAVEDGTLEVPGGRLEFLAFDAEVHALRTNSEGPSGTVDEEVEGPWSIEVVTESSAPPMPPWELEAGDWLDLQLSADLSSPSNPASIDARFLAEDGSATEVRVEFAESLTLTLDRVGLTRLEDEVSFTLVERLAPLRWFPNINLTNLDIESDGSILLSPSSNPVVYGQVTTALDQSARDWLDP